MDRPKIYLASSWDNPIYTKVLGGLRQNGYSVYNFKNPETAFNWGDLAADLPSYQYMTIEDYVHMIGHHVALRAFNQDRIAMKCCDLFILVMPAGASAHLEIGWAIGKGKPVLIYTETPLNPELTYNLVNGIYNHFADLLLAITDLDND